MPEQKQVASSELTGEPVVDLDDVLELAIEKEASDIHFGEGTKIAYRIDGKLTFAEGIGKSKKAAEQAAAGKALERFKRTL